jgi:hypothetical protein
MICRSVSNLEHAVILLRKRRATTENHTTGPHQRHETRGSGSGLYILNAGFETSPTHCCSCPTFVRTLSDTCISFASFHQLHVLDYHSLRYSRLKHQLACVLSTSCGKSVFNYLLTALLLIVDQSIPPLTLPTNSSQVSKR